MKKIIKAIVITTITILLTLFVLLLYLIAFGLMSLIITVTLLGIIACCIGLIVSINKLLDEETNAFSSILSAVIVGGLLLIIVNVAT